jgi:hypothetical protein
MGCPGTGRPGAGREATFAVEAPGAGTGALYTGRGPVCGMIMRGGGARGAAGLAGAATGICVTFDGGGATEEDWTTGEALPVVAAGVVAATRGGTAITVGAVLAEAAGVVAAAGAATGLFGGITTTDGGRYVAATEAGVTILGAGGAGGGVSIAGLGGIALGTDGDAETAGTSGLGSATGVVMGGLGAGRAVGCSAAPFCCVMARSTSPGREICERSILVLISSSP